MSKEATARSAMKLALDALVYASSYCDTYDAITALREALASEAAERPAQQESVGYVAENGVVDWNGCAPPILTDLYTSPQRTWVGLTDDERGELWYKFSYMELMKAIEAKLKEKNT